MGHEKICPTFLGQRKKLSPFCEALEHLAKTNVISNFNVGRQSVLAASKTCV